MNFISIKMIDIYLSDAVSVVRLDNKNHLSDIFTATHSLFSNSIENFYEGTSILMEFCIDDSILTIEKISNKYGYINHVINNSYSDYSDDELLLLYENLLCAHSVNKKCHLYSRLYYNKIIDTFASNSDCDYELKEKSESLSKHRERINNIERAIDSNREYMNRIDNQIRNIDMNCDVRILFSMYNEYRNISQRKIYIENIHREIQSLCNIRFIVENLKNVGNLHRTKVDFIDHKKYVNIFNDISGNIGQLEAECLEELSRINEFMIEHKDIEHKIECINKFLLETNIDVDELHAKYSDTMNKKNEINNMMNRYNILIKELENIQSEIRILKDKIDTERKSNALSFCIDAIRYANMIGMDNMSFAVRFDHKNMNNMEFFASKSCVYDMQQISKVLSSYELDILEIIIRVMLTNRKILSEYNEGTILSQLMDRNVNIDFLRKVGINAVFFDL